MTHSPIMRINCRRANAVKFGNSTRAGVLISSEDFRTLHLLAERDISVTLVCDGRPVYEGQVKALLQWGIHVADRREWYLPTNNTGPLKPPRLPPLVD